MNEGYILLGIIISGIAASLIGNRFCSRIKKDTAKIMGIILLAAIGAAVTLIIVW